MKGKTTACAQAIENMRACETLAGVCSCWLIEEGSPTHLMGWNELHNDLYLVTLGSLVFSYAWLRKPPLPRYQSLIVTKQLKHSLACF